MITIGTDSHKKTHTFVAVDDVGRHLGEKTLAATSEGHLQLVQWAAQWPQVTFALEDCRHMTRRLERDLLAAGKSDPIDAQAVALAALRHPDLPVAELDGPTRDIKLLVDHRRDLVAERTRVHNRLRWHLHEIDPTLHVPSRGLNRYCVLDQLAITLLQFEGVVARLARDLVDRARQLTQQINTLEVELRPIIRKLAPSLLAVPGCGILGAAMILGETAGVHRFRNKDAFARFTGTAPIPVWSGSTKGKVRLNRGGNRTLNTALHMIAVTQARGYGPGKAYLDKLDAAGKGRTEAIRLLRRRLSDVAFAALRTDERARLAADESAHQPAFTAAA